MAVTIIARVKGDFEGAEPSVLHYLGLGALTLVGIGGVVAVGREKNG